MDRSFRPSSDIQQQLTELDALIVQFEDSTDFASKLQLASLSCHRDELTAELDRSVAAELSDSDFVLAVSGGPVVGSAVQFAFLGQFMGLTQSLVNALAQSLLQTPTLKGNIPHRIIEAHTIYLDGAFASSFGMRLKFPEPREMEGLELPDKTKAVVDNLLSLLCAETDTEVLAQIISPPRVRSHFISLIEVISKSSASILMRTPRSKTPSRMSAKEAGELLEFLKTINNTVVTRTLRGKLTGGSIVRNNFEMEVDGETIKGTISEIAKAQMLNMTFGSFVDIEVEVNIRSSEEIGLEPSESFFLKSLSKADNH